MNDPLKQRAAEIDLCLLSDRGELRQLWQGMQRNARANKPFDRLQTKFDALHERSQAQLKLRQVPLQPTYDLQLPICQKREQILALLQEHQVLVLAGETGSGKTTQLPKFLLELGRGTLGLIGHTQPRRLAARAVATRIAEELGETLGQTVGYQVRFDATLGESARVKLMTDGILLAEAQHDPLLLKYDTLIIDEAHERSLNIDFLLGYLKRLLPKRPELKLIITSATIDLQRFSKHFNDAPVLEVSGRTYPVEVLYRPAEQQTSDDSDEQMLDLPQRVVAALEELEQREREGKGPKLGDSLVFLSGEREIREVAEQLRKAAAANQLRDIQVLPLYARLSQSEQNKIFHPSGRGRRVVLATNVAETSLTVPGIRYVIDSGLARISRYSVRSKVQRLPIEAISQASANQRKGRCGRIAEGVCIRLYAEEDFNGRPEFTDAEIMRTNLAAVILQMEALRLGAMEQFPFIDPPDSRQIRDGMTLLEELGAFSDGKLTEQGRQLSRLPVDPRIGRMLLEAAKQNCLSEVMVVAAVLGIQDPRERPADKRQQADEKHRLHQDPDSDFSSLINLWQHYEQQRQELSQSQLRSYCQKQFLSFMRMREWRDLHRQLHLACKELGLKENQQASSYEPVHRALLAGLLSHIGFKQEEREYLGARNRKFLLFPGSALSKGKAKWIIAAELVETSRLFARMVARIEPGWVEPLAPHLLKRSYSEPHWEKRAAQVVAHEKLTLYGLVIVPARKVNFGVIDPELSQQIFIRSALVEGEFTTQAAFFSHNRQLLEEVAALEDKTRRRDILIDEEQLFEFYRELLLKQGGERVVNGASFEKWRKTLEQRDPKALFLTKEVLMRQGASGASRHHYPDQLQTQGLKFRLHYQFSPTAEDDGVTIDVPVGALNRLPVKQLQWLVPGMLRDKCIALVKGLPKTLRKQCVPVPDRIDTFLAQAEPGESSLTEALATSLRRQTGVMICADDWNEAQIDKHYRFNIRVLDAQGGVLAQGRDWEALTEQFQGVAESQEQPQASEWERSDIKRWDFGELPGQIELDQAGMKVPGYPALSCQGESLAIRVFSTSAQAEHAHYWGVVRLLQLQLVRPLKELRSKLPDLDRSALLFAKQGSKGVLEADFYAGLCARVFLQQREGQPLPRTEQQFAALLEQGRSELWPCAEQLSKQLLQLLTQHQRLTKRLTGSIQLAWAPVLNDIRQQLSELIASGFICATPEPWWSRLPVYLQAIEIRLDKFAQSLQAQRLASEQLQSLQLQCAARLKQAQQAGADTEALLNYRWLLEEYRVSLFAQQLGTLQPVSEKRLRQQWLQIE